MRMTWLVVIVVGLAGCGQKAGMLPDLSMSPTVDLAQRMPACLPAGYTVVPFAVDTATHDFSKAESSLTAGKDYIAVLETDAGCLAIDLYEKETPITVNSFVFLTLQHYFDGIAFHRVIDGFMAQTGDPNTLADDRSQWGIGGPGYQFGLETNASLNFDGAGVVGMARTSNPNTNGSQFFITFAAATNLNQMYTVFGKVMAGLDVLPKITRGEPPTTPTRILFATIAAK